MDRSKFRYRDTVYAGNLHHCNTDTLKHQILLFLQYKRVLSDHPQVHLPLILYTRDLPDNRYHRSMCQYSNPDSHCISRNGIPLCLLRCMWCQLHLCQHPLLTDIPRRRTLLLRHLHKHNLPDTLKMSSTCKCRSFPLISADSNRFDTLNDKNMVHLYVRTWHQMIGILPKKCRSNNL